MTDYSKIYLRILSELPVHIKQQIVGDASASSGSNLFEKGGGDDQFVRLLTLPQMGQGMQGNLAIIKKGAQDDKVNFFQIADCIDCSLAGNHTREPLFKCPDR